MTDPVIKAAETAAVTAAVTKEESILAKAQVALAKNPVKWTLVALGVAAVIVVAVVHFVV